MPPHEQGQALASLPRQARNKTCFIGHGLTSVRQGGRTRPRLAVSATFCRSHNRLPEYALGRAPGAPAPDAAESVRHRGGWAAGPDQENRPTSAYLTVTIVHMPAM